MGGNYRHSEAPNLPAADRIPADAYDVVTFQILGHLVGRAVADIPHSVYEKTDHGDIDLLVMSSDMEQTRKIISSLTWVDPSTGESYLKQLTHPEAQNSYICTFDALDTTYNVQIDLTSTPEETYSFAFGYFSWNDLGNLIGRIAHRRGLKFGHDGLWYVHRRGDRLLGEFKLTDDFETALEYLGFDVERWYEGFDTFEDMFQYVASSKYFEKCAYPLEHQNHRARTRDSKRKTYNAFLEWINYDGEYVKSNRDEHIAQMRKDYPEVDAAIIASEKVDDLRMAYKELVNGIIVSEYFASMYGTKFQGKELGHLMAIVREVLPCNERVLKYSVGTINAGFDFALMIYREKDGA